ncbi:hypothetical protein COX58_03325 [archaeon CG_4_10_14_0_2_um_filter_Archaea_38_6]|nr:MAG: hypothetical protein COS83_00410 [archaeon CG07_land_8_20_14_0_80_38_8]PIU89258.1 MAG: hypothetical protein COS64_01580 [archaeon CG06_land_8_20_14_3_00_37_11]PJA21817.1 MAG: hypothetical protein COX58_03325 [archaeon CG_4_10_14_0_2_um_filter_Archaea_38_6]
MAKKAAKIKIKKKKWFEIALPKILKGEVFAEALAETPEKLIGRNINASLGDILSASKKHMNIALKINEVKTNTAHTRIKSISVNEHYLSRKTKKNSKISGRKITKTKDGVKVDLRLCAICTSHCLTTTKKEIRKKLEEFINNVVTKTKEEGLIMDLISNNIQLNAKKELHKIYPIRNVELEKLVIE